jgi:putative NADH-flavin reductase
VTVDDLADLAISYAFVAMSKTRLISKKLDFFVNSLNNTNSSRLIVVCDVGANRIEPSNRFIRPDYFDHDWMFR